MTAWNTEREAILKMMDKYGGGVFATVMDSYDYERALNKVIILFLYMPLHLVLSRSFQALQNFTRKREDCGCLDRILGIQWRQS
jgi:hypothetical protein